MDKNNFVETLMFYGVDPDIVCFDDYVSDDVFCVNKNYNIVEVFYRERGNVFGLLEFNSQSQALEYLLNKILNMSGIKKDKTGDKTGDG